MSFTVYSFPVANGALFEQKKLRYGVTVSCLSGVLV